MIGAIIALVGLYRETSKDSRFPMVASAYYILMLSFAATILEVVGIPLRFCDIGFIYWDLKRFLRSVSLIGHYTKSACTPALGSAKGIT